MFCEKLKELRIQKGITQKDIAIITGHQQTLVSKWELGEREPSFESLKKISKFFNVSIDTLLGNNFEYSVKQINKTNNELYLHNLKFLRKEKKLTQAQVAREINISQQTYANYENNKTEAPYDIIKKLANLYSCSIDELLNFNNNKNIELLVKKEEEKLEPYQKEFIEFVKSMSENECYIAKENINTIRKTIRSN